MKELIIKLDQIRRENVSLAGGKGANLGELLGQGFPVPPGFVVTAPAYEAFFRRLNLNEEVKGLNRLTSAELEQRCSGIRRMIDESELPVDLAAAIMSAHAELESAHGRDIVCAVRSSATAEDLGEASFAGQHETYYYVQDDQLLKMIKKCWASLWNPEAVSYRNSQGIEHTSVNMAVVVQEMILSEVSGVTFTANPVTGSRDEIVTESSWGMGAAIVDGRVTPDHWVMSRDGLKIREKRIACKRLMVPPILSENSPERLVEVPYELRQKETLSPESARVTAEWALKAEKHFGSPQDVEWAITGGRYYML
ncbi:MAG: PEP/pyruvate-binding domain-containing protein, partial [Pseudomonadota bacterium]